MADRYWVLGTGNWSDTGHWSASSGGAAGASVPTSSDNAIFNGSSGTGTATVNSGATRECLSLTCTAYAGTLTLATTLNIYGSLTFVSGMTFNSAGNVLAFRAATTGFTITSGSKSMGQMQFLTSAGGWTFQDTLTATLITVSAGTLDTNNKTVTGGWSISGGTVTFGTSTLNITGGTSPLFTVTSPAVVDLDAATMNINITSGSGDDTITLGGYTLYALTLTATSVKPMLAGTAGGRVNNITMAAGTSLEFYSLAVYTVDNWTFNGTSTSRNTITSDTAGNQATIQIGSGINPEGDYLSVKDIKINSPYYLFAGNHSIDNGNNINVIFRSYEYWLDTKEARSVVAGLQVSWKKDFISTIRLFTIGVSTIGGNDIIAATEQIDSQWNKYHYFDESQYLLSLDWEQGLNMPIGGIYQGLASGLLDNTSGRFTPRYMAGTSELFTAILPRRPFIINAGFDDSGVEVTNAQFVGLFTKQPEVNIRERTMGFSGADFLNFLGNRFVDNTEMFTGLRSDQLIENILVDLGYTTAQYELDYGINTIPFAIFNKGERFSDIINKISQAENAHFYQDNEGILRFENRQHWDNASSPDFDIFTSQVINAQAPDTDHIVNVVEIKADIREKQPLQTVFTLPTLTTIFIPANSDVEQFFAFEDPVLALTDPTVGGANSFYVANSAEDGSGTDLTTSIAITNLGTFAEAVKYRFRNTSSTGIYITQFNLAARIAKNTRSLYYRAQDDSSVTAYEERPLVVENPYIHEETWAESFAQMILNDYAEPENLQEITIMAISSLRVGSLVSWQGRYWRVFNKRTRLDPGVGFVQDLLLLQRTIKSYFRIGISTIGGGDQIAP